MYYMKTAKNFIFITVAFFTLSISAFALETFPFKGEVNSDNINVRIDATTSAAVILTLNKADLVDVVLELYDWYKIKLPKNAPAFVKKNLIEPIDAQTGKVIKDRVNIRLKPEEASAILGRADKQEIVKIISIEPGWYKIEPTDNTCGWIHKKFIDKADLTKLLQKEAIQENNGNIAIEGIISPYGKVLWRKATHKLIDKDEKVFLLKGDKNTLNTLNNQKVRITGCIIPPAKEKYPLIEVTKIEKLE